jgi:hypothetical protein
MYAMVSVLALVGWLAADSAWRRPGLVPLAGVAVCSALLLWTHYWSIWFLAVGASLLAVLAWRANAGGDRAARSAALRILAAVGVGGLTFAPWLPTLWYQRAHTGTPWTRPSRPAEVLSTLASDLGGGGTGEAAVLGWLVLVLAAGGLWLRVSTPWELTADLRRPRGPAALSMAVLAGGTLVVGGLGGYLTGAGFASRYASVVLPFVVVLAATAVAELRPRALGVSVLGLIGLLSSLGLARNVTDDRSDARALRRGDRGRGGRARRPGRLLPGPARAVHLPGAGRRLRPGDLPRLRPARSGRLGRLHGAPRRRVARDVRERGAGAGRAIARSSSCTAPCTSPTETSAPRCSTSSVGCGVRRCSPPPPSPPSRPGWSASRPGPDEREPWARPAAGSSVLGGHRVGRHVHLRLVVGGGHLPGLATELGPELPRHDPHGPYQASVTSDSQRGQVKSRSGHRVGQGHRASLARAAGPSMVMPQRAVSGPGRRRRPWVRGPPDLEPSDRHDLRRAEARHAGAPGVHHAGGPEPVRKNVVIWPSCW